MTQPEFNFKEEREKTKRSLAYLEGIILDLLTVCPTLREISHRNDLIRAVWSQEDPNIPAESITRTARNIMARGIMDTENNQRIRANQQTAFHDYFKKR